MGESGAITGHTEARAMLDVFVSVGAARFDATWTPPGGSRRWPSYERGVDDAPLNSEQTGPDVSRADFVFCMTAITWGWSVEGSPHDLSKIVR